jgi:hypothetical protein
MPRSAWMTLQVRSTKLLQTLVCNQSQNKGRQGLLCLPFFNGH